MSKWNLKKSNHLKYITCKDVSFYSDTDEAAFFWMIDQITCIISISGAKNELYLDLQEANLSSKDIKELIGLCARYTLDMSQLAPLKTPENAIGFAAWTDEIFRT